MRSAVLILLSLSVAAPSFAQDARPVMTEAPRLIISERAVAMGIAATPPARMQSSRDSLKNGAIIGAVIGAAALGGFVTFLCHALKEPGDPSCWRGVLTISALGAGAGAAAGAGIDALLVRQSVRFPPASPRR